MSSRFAVFCGLFLFVFTSLAVAQRALAAPTLSNLTLTEVAAFASTPVEVTHAGDDRLFVLEKAGRIRIVENGNSLRATPFLDIQSKVRSLGEQGLLGLAFHPDYAQNGLFFVSYIDNNEDTVIAKYEVNALDPNVANSAETVILTVDQPRSNHNSGPIRFGPDGYLYITLGDSGSGGDPDDVAQDGAELLGKILRIDVTDVATYTVPASNPFTQTVGIRDEIWAMGLRNPWRFDFDSLTGDLWLADVGQNRFEEVNFVPAGTPFGLNFGWDCYEGNYEYDSLGDTGSPSAACNDSTIYTPPIHDYSHDVGCSITGGAVYRGSEHPAMFGHYFFGDYCTNEIWAIEQTLGSATVYTLTVTGGTWNPSAFGTGVDGEMYVAFDGQDKVFKMGTTDAAPTAVRFSSNSTATLSSVLLGTLFMVGLAVSAMVYQKARTARQ